jgi:hypothetical protein
MPSIVINANAPLKDRNGIAKRDPTAGAKHLFAAELRSNIATCASAADTQR